MKQHGLLFQPDMARANVAGLKTMTRRGNGLKAINANPDAWRFDGWISDTTGDKKLIGRAAWSPVGNAKYDCSGHIAVKCPWQVGDMIYQRETWLSDRAYDSMPPREIIPGSHVKYLADGIIQAGKFAPEIFRPGKTRSPIFLPKWAARYWAEIISIKVERVRDISAEDCIKEGLSTSLREHDAVVHLRDQYRDLYDSINNAGRFDRDWC